MSRGYAPEALTCPEPEECPVAIDKLTELARNRQLPVTTVESGTSWSRVYDSRFGHFEFNPGFGNARFSPFDSATETDSATDRRRVATIYVAATLEAALLEGALRDVDENGIPEAEEESFQGLLHAELQSAKTFTVADLRDERLESWGLDRSAVASSPSQHYPCTRTVAKAIHASDQNLSGILWHSRQVEVNDLPRAEALVLFEERHVDGRNAFTLNPGRESIGALYEGVGRIELDSILERLGVSVVDYWK